MSVPVTTLPGMTKSRSRKNRAPASRSSSVDLARLRRGIPVGRTGTRVRLATEGDRPTVGGFLRQALDKSPAEDPGDVPTVCPSIEAALGGGQPAFTRALAGVLVRPNSEGPVSFALVAEDPTGQPVGAVVCAPPYGLIAE